MGKSRLVKTHPLCQCSVQGLEGSISHKGEYGILRRKLVLGRKGGGGSHTRENDRQWASLELETLDNP